VVIDGTMDNASSNAMDSYDKKVHWRATRIREEGWRQIPDWPKHGEDLQNWPAPGQTSSVTLTQKQWEFIASALDEGAVTSDHLAALPHFAESRNEWLEDAADTRRLAAQIRQKLAS
jgi:hypothetical protein